MPKKLSDIFSGRAGAVLTICLVLAATAASTLFFLPHTGAHADSSSTSSGTVSHNTTVILIHGLEDGSGTDCNGWWKTTINYLKQSHGSYTPWTGPIATIGFYNGDTNCSSNLVNYAAKCDNYYAGNEGTNNEALEHVACELAWYIYGLNRHHQRVQIVAHSMGGIIARMAIAMSGDHIKDADRDTGDCDSDGKNVPFPGGCLQVDHVVTFGTPHGGLELPGARFFGCGNCLQGKELQSGSSLMQTLQTAPFQAPQAHWTLIGSLSDHVGSLTHKTFTYMLGGDHYVYTDYDHFGYLRDTSDTGDAPQYTCISTTAKCAPTAPDTGTTQGRLNGFHSLKLMRISLGV